MILLVENIFITYDYVRHVDILVTERVVNEAKPERYECVKQWLYSVS